MASSDRKNIHDDLDDLLEDNDSQGREGGFGDFGD